MEKKFWWFSKKNEPANDLEDLNNGYYGDNASVNAAGDENAYDYSDSDVSDISVALSGDPSKKEPLMKKTFTPESCTESQDIVDAYKEGRVVVICIENLDKANFLRLFDYLMGAVHALDGELEKVTKNLVVLWPAGVDTSLDIDEIEDEPYEEYDEEEISEDEEA